MWDIFDIDIELYGVEFLMRDLVGILMILCVKYIELNCEERLEENFGDIVRYVYWKSSAGCWSKA